MELKLNIYTDKFCRTVEREATAEAFELSVGICEDILDIINIDMFESGLDLHSDESLLEIAIPIVRNAFPFFKEFLQELFDVTEDEIKRTKISDVARVIIAIVKYSISQLKTLCGKNSKN